MGQNGDVKRFVETLHPTYRQDFSVIGTPIIDEQTEYQHLVLFENETFGKVLALDSVIQITDKDEGAYSEMLVHLPAFEHGALERVMIVGGGDGAVAEEALKHQSVSAVDLVDIDERVIAVSKEHLREIHKGAFDDPRLTVRTQDAAAFLAQPAQQSRYDLLVADRPDPIGPGALLFAESFYENCAKALRPRGIAVFQTGCPTLQAEELTETLRLLKKAFNYAGVYLTVVPTYIGGFMALTWASNDLELGVPVLLEEAAYRFEQNPLPTDYYTPAIHRAAYALPRWMSPLVEAANQP